MEKYRQRKHFGYIIIATLLSFFMLFALLPVNFAAALQAEADDYEAFNASLMSMLTKYDDWDNEIVLEKEEYLLENDSIYVTDQVADRYGLNRTQEQVQGFYASESDRLKLKDGTAVIERTPQTNRLIVCSDKIMDSHGAVMKAEYEDFHIFQYTTSQEADEAYRFFVNSNLEVSYDDIVSVDGQVEENAVGDSATFSYNSWGAEYVGYAEFTEFMLKVYAESELNEVVVAVIDSGIYTSHELFAGRILPGFNFTTEASSSGYAYEDYKNHGTHVSGIIANATRSNVKILPLKVLNKDGDGTVSMIVNAIKKAESLKKSTYPNLMVANMSIGIKKTSNSSGVNPTLQNAVKDLYAAGVLPVVSAGNDSQNTTYACPANVSEAVTVSALKLEGGQLLFDSYSNYGSHVDFAAPGTRIKSAGLSSPNAYISMSGTSMAAPHVTGAIALLYSLPTFKNLSFEDLLKMLQDNAVDLGAKGKDRYYGYGCLNIANIGAPSVGEVDITMLPTVKGYTLWLSYDTETDYDVKIYYSLDEDAEFVNQQNTLYSSPISINKTTKLTAVAFAFDSGGVLMQMSAIRSEVVYVDDYDLDNQFTFKSTTGGVVLTKYNGPLTTLKVKQKVMFNGSEQTIVEIGENAFSDSSVQNLQLPASVVLIGKSAFYRSLSIKQVVCDSENLTVSDYAFYGCSNLNSFVSDVTSIGNYAFAHCTSLKDLNLPYVKSVGSSAISGSGIETLLVGKNITTFANQSASNLNTIYGYAGTVVSSFANKNNIRFVDLTLRITKNFNSRIIQRLNEDVKLNFKFVGLNTNWEISLKDSAGRVVDKVDSLQAYAASDAPKITGNWNRSDYETNFDLVLNNLKVDTYTLDVFAYDFYSQTIKSEIIAIDVIDESAKVCQVNSAQGDYDIYVNGVPIDEIEIYSGQTYSFEIVAKNGFDISRLSIDDQLQSTSTQESVVVEWTIGDNLTFDVETEEKQFLNVEFSVGTTGSVSVAVGQNVFSQNQTVLAERNSTLSFTLTPYGCTIIRVNVDGEEISANGNGVYEISNITQNHFVEVIYEHDYCDIQIVWGRGGSVSTIGELEGQAEFGSSRTYTISTYDGYVLDTVLVNGELVDVKNHTLTLNNISEDTEIFISFKKNTNVLSGTILTYVYIFAGIFVAFVIAKLSLFIYRKTHKKD